MPKVKDIVDLIELWAKPEYAFSWDNSGLCCGNSENAVTGVLVTLDVTPEVAREAIEKRCNLIISHHPVIFKGIKTLNENTFEGAVLSLLLQNGIALYSAHTSLDCARGGVNDSLCELLGVKATETLCGRDINGESVSCVRKGRFTEAVSGEELKERIRLKTGADTLLCYGIDGRSFSTCAMCTGGGEEYIFYHDADVFITGEIKYHTALEAKHRNMPFIAAGHYFTEKCMIHSVASYLQKTDIVVQYKIPVYETEINTNPFDK